MAWSFDRWEKDPFFPAAEEVQESADRMESTYRTWIHAKKNDSSMWNSEELRRDLHTALGTTKWQLEEFERAVKSSYPSSPIDDARERHRQFIIAIEDQILKIENSLIESVASNGKASVPWVRLDKGERDELALFLSGPSVVEEKNTAKDNVMGSTEKQETDIESAPDCSKALLSSEWDSLEAGGRKVNGHRRIASASADFSAWKIAVANDDSLDGQSYLEGQPGRPPRKIPSFSGFLSSIESSSKLKWPKNAYRKLKVMDCQEGYEVASLRNPQFSRGIDACYEKSKSCLESCDYGKQLTGWYGALQRQLQRSQYQVQYRRPVHVALWMVFLLCLIVLITLRAI